MIKYRDIKLFECIMDLGNKGACKRRIFAMNSESAREQIEKIYGYEVVFIKEIEDVDFKSDIIEKISNGYELKDYEKDLIINILKESL